MAEIYGEAMRKRLITCRQPALLPAELTLNQQPKFSTGIKVRDRPSSAVKNQPRLTIYKLVSTSVTAAG